VDLVVRHRDRSSRNPGLVVNAYRQKEEAGSPGRNVVRRWAGRWPILPGLLAVLLLFLWLVPYGASAYHLEVGGRALEQAIAAGDPPDPTTLTRATEHLEAALHWHADNAQACRLLSHVHLLQDDLTGAAQAAVRYATAEPGDPLRWWELAQIYKTMGLWLEAGPGVNLLEGLPQASATTPDKPINTAYCDQEERSDSCYQALTEWQMPLAPSSQPPGLEPLGAAVDRDTLFLHPPSQVEWRVTVPADAPVLVFWMGTDPSAWDLMGDGVTFRVAVNGTEAFSHHLSAEEARQGWWPAEVDLQSWTGQEVNLILETDVGPAGDGQGDWGGWGDVRLVSTEAAEYARLAPVDRLKAAWHTAGFVPANALHALDLAWQSGHYGEVLVWHRVAEVPEEPLPAPLQFRLAVAAIVNGLEPPHPADPAVLTIHPVTDVVRIEGEALQWLLTDPYQNLDYGDRLGDQASLDPTAGTMWWAETAVAVVQVQEEANYEITLRAKHSTANPGRLQVGHNLAPVAEFPLTPDWQEFTTTLRLSPGLHVIDLRYMQDSGDAVVDWIQLQETAESG
jgi:hypothetical protein